MLFGPAMRMCVDVGAQLAFRSVARTGGLVRIKDGEFVAGEHGWLVPLESGGGTCRSQQWQWGQG